MVKLLIDRIKKWLNRFLQRYGKYFTLRSLTIAILLAIMGYKIQKKQYEAQISQLRAKNFKYTTQNQDSENQ